MRKDQRRWHTVTLKLPAPIARDFAKAMWIAARMCGSPRDAPCIESMVAECLSSWLPAYEQHRREKQESDRAYDRVWWAVLERDAWQCTRCGSVRDLQVHHIEHRSLRPDLVEDPDNCETVCARCHDEEHRG